MKSKQEIEETLEKNRGTDFVIPMSWDVMFEQMFISKEVMPLLEYIISIFSHYCLRNHTRRSSFRTTNNNRRNIR